MAVTPQTDKRLWRLKKGDTRPLYRQIESLILELVEAGHLGPGSALPSYLWLSKTLEVADKTVRQAYADLAQAGVLSVRKGRGTFVAKNRARAKAPGGSHAGVLGLLAPPLPVEPAHAEVFWRLVRAIQEAAYREHLDTMLLPRGGDLNAPGIAERLADPARVDGLILLHDPGAGLLQRLGALGVPVLLADVPAEDGQARSAARVVFDHRGAARALTYKLIGAGHRRISLVAPARDARAREWELGWRHAMGAAGLPVEPGWGTAVDLDLGETGASAIDRVLGDGPTALLACTDALAKCAARCVAASGRAVPRGLSLAAVVTGEPEPLHGEVRWAAAVLDPEELGRVAVRRLARMVRGEEAAPGDEGGAETANPTQVVEARIEDGESIAAPAAEG